MFLILKRKHAVLELFFKWRNEIFESILYKLIKGMEQSHRLISHDNFTE